MEQQKLLKKIKTETSDSANFFVDEMENYLIEPAEG